MLSTATASNWREEFQLAVEHLLQSVSVELSDTKSTGRSDGAREAAEGLNQTVRRLKGSASEAELLSILVEAGAAFSKRSAAILLDGARARTTEIRGFVSPEIHFEIPHAAAVMAAVETKDPVVAAATETELSPSFYQAAMRDVEQPDRAYLFPLVTAGSVRALLFATGAVQPAPLELLSETAAMRWEVLEAEARLRPKAPPGLVTIGPSQTSRAWTDLSQQEQALHLKAQRFARVKVAEMRLGKPGAVRDGQEHGDLYRSLKPEIDAAREAFRKEFVASNPATAHPAMVDYLYIELVRSLAHDDDRLLGPDFPGLLV